MEQLTELKQDEQYEAYLFAKEFIDFFKKINPDKAKRLEEAIVEYEIKLEGI